jgi:hypothetical protein
VPYASRTARAGRSGPFPGHYGRHRPDRQCPAGSARDREREVIRLGDLSNPTADRVEPDQGAEMATQEGPASTLKDINLGESGNAAGMSRHLDAG